MKRERRTVPAAEVRIPEGGAGRTFEAVVLRYNVIDDYDTRFRPGVFTESLQQRLPRIVWAHRWDDPIGRWTDYRDTNTELTLIGELDDFEAVPRARQASAQLQSGTIDQFSVGFMRLADEMVDPDDVGGQRGVVDITKGQLDEVSLVLVGAVPGTELVSVRAAAGVVDFDAVLEIARRKAAGDLTDAEADEMVKLLAGTDATGQTMTEAEGDTVTGDGSGHALDETDAVLAEADAALEAMED